MYIDTDVLVLRPVQDIWKHFEEFNSTQMVAVAPETESKNAGWYNRFARHPYYGPLGGSRFQPYISSLFFSYFKVVEINQNARIFNTFINIFK